MNADMFRAVADVIEREGRFDLSSYADMDGKKAMEIAPSDVIDNCGTTACIAGWVNALTDHKALWDEAHAAAVLGIDEELAADRLFHWGSESVWAQLADDLGGIDIDDTVGPWLGDLRIPSQITSVQASKVLRMIADGEIDL